MEEQKRSVHGGLESKGAGVGAGGNVGHSRKIDLEIEDVGSAAGGDNEAEVGIDEGESGACAAEACGLSERGIARGNSGGDLAEDGGRRNEMGGRAAIGESRG